MAVSYGDHIKAFRKAKGLTQEQLGEIADISGSAISQWESNYNEPTMRALERIAKHFAVPKSAILGEIPLLKGAIEAKTDDSAYTVVPLYGIIAAGEPIEMCAVQDSYPILQMVADRNPGCFLLKINGESMNRVLPSYSYALVVPTEDVVDGKVYALNINGDDATVKRVRRLNNGFELLPDSTDPTFQPKIYDYNNTETERIRIIGRVVQPVIPFDFEI